MQDSNKKNCRTYYFTITKEIAELIYFSIFGFFYSNIAGYSSCQISSMKLGFVTSKLEVLSLSWGVCSLFHREQLNKL